MFVIMNRKKLVYYRDDIKLIKTMYIIYINLTKKYESTHILFSMYNIIYLDHNINVLLLHLCKLRYNIIGK